MPKKEWTEAERKAFGDKMRAARRKKNVTEVIEEVPKEHQTAIPESTPEEVQDIVQDSLSLEAMQRQINEVMETNALLKAALLGQANQSNNVGVKGTQLIGEVDKYLVDPSNYPDPTKRLAAEPRLQSIAFNHNYELEYRFSIRPYETKTGINMREPEFLVTLLRIVLDDQGERVQVRNKDGKLESKFYIAKRLMFHEDPQAALVIARDNNIDIDRDDEQTFLNEMRYIRVRDWLFGVFWPLPAQPASNIREEVIGGTLVQVYTKNSVEPSAVDFDQLQTKVQA